MNERKRPFSYEIFSEDGSMIGHATMTPTQADNFMKQLAMNGVRAKIYDLSPDENLTLAVMSGDEQIEELEELPERSGL